MRHLRSILSTLAILLAAFAAQAADGDSIVRPVNVAYTAEYGAASLLDTYLTQYATRGGMCASAMSETRLCASRLANG